ncbi:hypothetical protein NE237_029946 [Protea cynaroides]|uniref:Major facilitator superfamily (MFS) profile domain-containing protein n=1 Tax=Protea cynaroides TaxID=273540 RepID=A0A9Q0GT51_9MAGN|nr:hypothetical protein NE237_029946 [Protea cynaroides]
MSNLLAGSNRWSHIHGTISEEVLPKALGGAAVNVYMLILGRVLLGIGVGFTNQSVPLYLSVMALPQYRGAFNIGFQVCVGIGVLSANLINYGTEMIKGGWGW